MKQTLKNALFAYRIIFKHAPVIALVYIVLSLTGAVFTGVEVRALAKLIDTVTRYVQHVDSIKTVALFCIIYLGTIFFGNIYTFSIGILGRRLYKRLTITLSPEIMKKLCSIEYRYYEDRRFLDVMDMMTKEPQQTIHNAFFSTITCVNAVLKLISILLVFCRSSLLTGIGALVIGIPMAILEINSTNKDQQNRRKKTREKRFNDYLHRLFASKDAMYETKIFGSEAFLRNKWEDNSSEMFKYERDTANTFSRNQLIVGMLKVIYIGGTIAVLSLGFSHGQVTLGVYVSIISTIGKLFGALNTAAYSLSTLDSRTKEIGYFREFLAFDDETYGTENIEGNVIRVEFDHVSFSYPGCERKVLNDLSFVFDSCEHLALVGENGCGKTTAVKLMLGLYKPDKGEIRINNKPLGMYSKAALRKAFSAVFQDYGKYSMSVRENILMRERTSKEDDIQTEAVLNQLFFDDLAHIKPEDILGKLDDNGIDISGGQWQKLALARAFHKESNVMIMDEPTASLDPIAESRLYEMFLGVVRTQGTLIISHRLASARLSDRIILMSEGKVIEEGTHKALMEKKGKYFDMYNEQSFWYKENGRYA